MCVCVHVYISYFFLQVPSITKVESDGLNQSHHDQNSDKDELVVVWQGRVLAETTKQSAIKSI